MGLGAIVASCARLAADGATHDEVVAHARDLADRTHVWGALDTLDNLKKGGRIGGAKALLASALAIKPIIEVRDGKVEQGGKQRTRSKALAFLVEKVAAVDGLDSLSVLHADCRDVDQFVDMLRPHVDGEIVVGDIGPVVGSHAGRGTIGVAFFTRKPVASLIARFPRPCATSVRGRTCQQRSLARPALHPSLPRYSPSDTSWSDGSRKAAWPRSGWRPIWR